MIISFVIAYSSVTIPGRIDLVLKKEYILKALTKVYLSDVAEKQLKKLPLYIVLKFFTWVTLLKEHGLQEARKAKGFHDEPLKGDRRGQRSIRLNHSYRAIYIEIGHSLKLVRILEVNKHEY